MTAADLKPEQLSAVAAIVARHLRFYGKLRARMDRLGWSPADAVRRDVERAWERVYALSVELHYANSPGGRGGAHPPPVFGADGPGVAS